MSETITLDTSAGALLAKLQERHSQQQPEPEAEPEAQAEALDEIDEQPPLEVADDDPQPEPVADLVTIDLGEEAYELPQALIDHIRGEVKPGELSADDRASLDKAREVADQYAAKLEAIAAVTPEPQEPDWNALVAQMEAGKITEAQLMRAQLDWNNRSRAYRQMQDELATARRTQYEEAIKQRDRVLTDPSAGIKGWDNEQRRKADVERDMKLAARFGIDAKTYQSIVDPRFHRLVNYAASLSEQATKPGTKRTVRAISSKGPRQPVQSAQKQRDSRAAFAEIAQAGGTDIDGMLRLARSARS